MLSRILSLLFDEQNRQNASNSGDYVHRIAQIGASKLVFTLLTFAITSPSFSQTSWTENASGYNIDLGGNKNGGFAFCDYDLDGDFDLVVNRNNRSYFYRNNGGSFTDVTSSVAPALAWDGRERCVVWGDLNNDGWPDFARNTSSDGVEVYLQDPSTNTFGDGTGGNTPQDYNGSASGSFYVADGMNSEGMGFLDYNGDGFLDIIFDNHDHGIDMLENDGTGNFTHVTAITGSYQWWNPASWPLGLAQESTDGDYGSTTDYDNDGWVDFISRKRDQVDFFRNVGGTFEESIDVAQASNGNRGAVNFSDFDNDGDFDLFWTENDDNQIFENNNGNFVALGNATGIPTGFGSNRIDGMACGDVDNDGDIDIFLAGDQTGILFINQINDPLLGANVGAPMTFVQDSYTFYSGDGEGSSFVDVDNDGDLDLYVNIRNGNNRLFINQLSGTPSNNYLFVDIKENRASANMPSGVERDALGATLRLVDCEGNVISGIREINGGNGHGTQDVARIHFGLPNGPADYYILQASYPNIVGEDRYQINEEIRPADYAYQLYEIAPAASTNNAPEGQNDIVYYTENTTITIDVIADNGNGMDSDPDGDPLTVMTTLGTSPSNGTAIVNANNTITYTPDADFIGIDSFTYYLSDNPTCPAAGMTEEVTVELIYQGSLDNCVIGFDPYTWTQISPNDDGSVGPVALPFDFDLYGTTYSSVYINNNGNVSFDNPYWWYTSTGFPITTPMVAPFWGDVDTRDWFANGYQGEVWYNVTPDAIYVTWMNVGPYYAGNAAHDDLQDTFTLVMSDGSGTVLAPGNNVAFFYGDMDWTTGSASGGTNGFGGSPATVGINAGNGVDYILMGMFDSDTDDYDGPGGDNDGVNWLEDQCLEFDVSSATNFPPVAQGFPQDNSINVCYGETQDITLGFTGPEFAETVSISMNDYAWSGVTVNSNTTGNPGEIDLTLSGDAVGTYLLTFTATDNNSSPETTVVDLTVNVIDCNCSAPPSVICPPTVSADIDAGSCDATVSVPQPSVLSACFGFNALDFGATGDYVGLQDIVPNGDFSIEFWFQPEASSWSGTLFDMSEDNAAQGSNQRYFYISGDDSGMTFAFESDDDADIQIDVNYDFSEVRWYHIVAVGTFGANDQHQLYIDGTLAGSDDTDASAKPSTYELPRIGTYGSAYLVPQNEFNGLIDNFRIYDTRLNSATVNEIACGDLTAVPNNIVTNLDFEDGAGSAQASDVSINGNNGALVNMDINTAWVYSDLVMECMTVTNDYNGTEDASGTYPLGTTTVTWTVTNTAGASSSCTHDVIVADTENPTATCQNMTLYLDASGQASLDPSDIEVSSSDNCGIADISLSQTTFDCADLTAPLVVSSANGYDVIIDVNAVSINTATASCPWGYSYTVELDYDVSFTGVNIPSNLYTLQGTIGCDPANHFFNLPNSGGSGSVTSANSYNSDSDCATATPESLGCNTITIQISGPGIPETFIVMPSNTVPVDLIVEDNAGNIGTCTAEITIIDDIAPTITCAADISTSTNAAGCTANVTVPAPSAADNCSVASLTNDYNGTASANDNYPVGTTTITWTVTDNSGNTATCTQNITVTNNLSANAGTNVTICEGETTTLTASATGSGPFNYLWDSGLGMGESHTVSPIPSAYANENFTYNVTVTDANGCTDTDQVTVTVESTPDATYTTVDPTCGLNNGSITFNFIDHPNRTGIEFSIDGGSSYESTVADNSGSVTYNGLAPGSYTLITRWGNNECPITLGTAVLTDIDNTPPTVSCPSNISVGANAAGCNASVSVPPVTANDNCSIASIVNDYTGTSDASGTYPVGTTTVNWTVTDYNGNTATCSMTVTVVDDVDPTITCPANISVGTDDDDCFATVALGTPTTDDNCAVASVSNDAPATFPIGTTNVTWTVTDNAGNTATCVQTVTVADDEDPTISCPANISVGTDADDCFATVALGTPTTDDNCAVASVSNDAPATFPIGTTNVTWTVTDNAGNTATCVQTVTVADDEDPTISCAGNVSVNTNTAGCTANVTVPAPSAADNCSVASLTNDYNGTASANDNYPVGTTTITWTVTDNSGNTATCTQNITVTNNLSANAGTNVTICEGESTTLTASATGSGPFNYLWDSGLGMGESHTVSPIPSAYANENFTYNVTVTDANGCTDTDQVTVTVESTPDATYTTVDPTCGLNNGSITFNFIDHPNRTGIEFSIDGGSSYESTVADNSGSVTYNGLAPGSYTLITRWGNNECPITLGTAVLTDIDNTPPTVSCPSNISVGANAAGCNASVSVPPVTANDNCSIASIVNDYTGTSDASGTYPVGTTTVNWTVTDYNGNTATCSMTVTVVDDVDPTITCPANISVGTDDDDCFATVALGTPTTDDNCAVASVSNDAPATFPIGTTNVTWTVTDNAGNTATCVQTVTVADDEDPTISCPANISVGTDADDCFATVALGTPTTDDNCGVANVSNDAPATFPIGTTNVTWTVTDNAGNTATCVQTVTVADDEDPTISCPANISVGTDADDCFATVALGTPTTDDNCAVASVSNDAPATFPIGTTNVTWTVTDNAGNTATCVQTVTVADDEDPTISCPANISVGTDADDCFATVALGTPTTDDNCAVASVSNDAPATFPIGTTNVTWTVTDNAGNTATCVQTVTVADDEDPTISCPANISVGTDDDDCFATVALGTPTTDDNCAVASVSNDAPATFPIGTTNVTWTVTDNAGNTATCVQTVTVADDEDPTISCPANISVGTDADDCFATVALGTPTTDDNCAVASVSNDAPATFPIGTTNVTWTVTDNAGNTATCVQTVTVADDEDPTISCPANISVGTDDDDCFATVALGTPTTDDNCAVASVSNDAPATFPIGTTNVTWTVTDNAGNTATCVQTVTVADDEDPTISCPANISVGTDADDCFATVALGTPTTDDNCGVANVSNDAPATFPIGTTNVTWTVTDNAGNTATCVQTVTVADDEDPTISCPANISVGTDADDCFATVALGTPTTDDNCAVASVSNDAPATFPIGTTNVTWTVTDNAGNTATCVQTVTVADDEDPTISCPANISVGTDADDCFATVALGTPTTDDNCAVASVSNDAPATFPIGTTNVTWTVTDNAGNTATCVQTVTVADDEDPTISCPANISVGTDADDCFATVALGTPTTDDNCAVASVSNDAPATFPIGTTNVTWTVTDNAGNTATCVQTVTVADDEDPTISCPANISVGTDADDCFATVALGTPTTDDNCAVASVSNDAPATFPIGTTNVTWTVTDNAGNTATCVQTVTVADDEDPTISCPANISVGTDDDDCFATVALGTPTTDDNCAVASVSNDAPATFPIGTTNVTWTVTDNAGNTATCVQTVTVADDEDPTISCPANISVGTDDDDCFATVALGTPTTDDNCAVASVSNDAPATFPIGTTNVTWTVTDNAGNTATCIQTVTVADDEDPTISCPANISVGTDADDCFATVALGTPTTDDNCAVASVSNDAPATFPIGTTNVTWTVTDNAGNTATCVQTVTVADDEDPTISCPANISVGTDDDDCFATVALGTPTTDDNCAVGSVSNDAPATFPIGTTNVTWTVTDNAGNTATCVQTVTVADDEDPTISCPANISVGTDADDCFATVALGTPTTDDNCAVASVSNDAPATFPIGTTNVTWTVTDNAGNTATCVQTVTVADDEDPTISCPANISVGTDADDCFATVALGTPTTDDNCAVASVSNDAPATFPIGTTNVTWTVIDNAGNTATCVQTVTVADDEDPTISCPANITQPADDGESFATVTIPIPTTDDNCAVVSVTNDITGTDNASGTYPLGITTITWTVTDAAGNTTTCAQTVNISDDEAPEITCPGDQTENVDAGCVLTLPDYTGLGTATDNTDPILIITQSPAPGTVVTSDTVVTLSTTDSAGNTSTCSFTVIITDVINPTISCPADLTLTADNGDCSALVSIAIPTTDDNCSVASVINDYTGTNNATGTYPVGVTTVTYTVTDGSGNTTTCSFTVTVTDNEAPVVTCPANITQTADAGVCEASVSVPALAEDDNCAVDTIVNDYNGTADASDVYPVGTTTVTFTVTDIHGNISTCTFTVTVTDNENPTIDCPANISVGTNDDDCFATVALGTPTTDDNCAVASVSNDAPATFPIGTTNVTWTVTDNAGNTATCVQTVTVADDEDPTISCPANISVGTDADDCFATVALGTPTTDDNCGVANVSNDAPATFPIGTTNVTWTVTDNAGNTATCVQTVTVADDEDPTISCPANISVGTDDDDCFATVALGTPTTDDNCAVASVSNDAPATFPVGTTNVTWTVIDNAGNTATCVQTVTVADDEDPTISCPANISVGTDDDDCFATVALGTPTTDDNCAVASVSNDAPATFPIGTTNVTWTVTDNAGNTATCVQTVTVADDEDPTISCPANISVGTDADDCFATVALGTPTTDDNCAVASVSNDAPATFPIGTTNVTWTVTDNAGNTATCVQTVTVADDEDPTISCPANISVGTDADDCFATVALGTPTTDDNCAVASVSNDAPATFPVGTTNVTWTVIDNAGNTATCVQTITVADDEIPSIDCPADINVSADANCAFTVGNYISLVTSDDNCDLSLDITQSPAPGTVVTGTTTVTMTSTDDAGNSNSCTFQLIVEDNTDPVITTCAPDATINVDGDCEALLPDYTSLAAATDNCDTDVTFTQSPAPSSSFAGHGTVITVTLTATDDNGNTDECTFDVTLLDDINPTIDCPTNITVTADANNCDAAVTIPVPTTDDNCVVASVINDYTGTDNASATYPVGTTTVTYTVTDVAGNTAMCSFTVTVTDNEAPSIVCPADITVTADAGNCDAAITITIPTTDDNCAVASVVNNYNNTNNASDTYPVGTTTVIYTVTDIHGNDTTCAFDITVTDNEIPEITCPANLTQTADNGSCDAFVAIPVPATDDNCTVASVINDYTGTDDASATYPVGTTTVIYTVTDAAGNIETCAFTVTITDDEAPEITCPANITQTADAGVCEASVSVPALAEDDNCAVDTIVNDYNGTADASDVYPVGTTTVTFTVTDIHGNVSTCAFTVTVTDNENPTIDCPANITVGTDADDCFATVALGTPTTDDNCGVASVSNDAPATFPIGTTNVTWTVTDNAGNTAACVQTVTVADDQDPTISCPANISVGTDTDDCFATVALGTPTTDDNCAVASVSNDAPATFPIGTTNVTWTVTDNAGNTATCVQTVAVADDQDPTISCPANISVGTDADDCFAAVALGTPTTDDNCGVANVSNDAPATFPIGTTNVTWTVTDNAGNTATCVQTVTVADDEIPSIDCPADISVSADANCAFTVGNYLAMVSADDNCDTSLDLVQVPAPGDIVAGTTIVTVTATDDAGNSNSCTFQLIVEDNTDPVITTCAPDATINVDGDCEALLPDYTSLAAATDNCDTDVTFTQSPAPSSSFAGHGTVITVTLTATDDNGNTDECTFDVTLLDDINPTIDCPTNITVTADANNCDAAVTIPVPTTDDNCVVASVINDYTGTDNASATYPVGTTTVTYTVTDVAGNTAMCSFTVIVTDNEAPSIVCPADITVTADAGNCDAAITITIPTTDDNCAVASVVNNYNNTNNASDTYPVGTTTVIYTVTDIHGNDTTCAFDITVTDNEIPEITCPANLTQTADNGSCDAFVAIPVPATDDNCTVASVINDYTGTDDASATYPVGTTTVIYTVTDAAGNIETCAFTVTITDDEAPEITCPANITQTADAGVCEASVSVPALAEDDNCAVDTIVNDYNGTADASDVYPVGTTTVTFTVTDIHGNVSTCAFTVTVTDNENPTIDCPANITQAADAGSCDGTVIVPLPTTEDNCAVASVENDFNGTDSASGVYPPGNTTVIWTVTDVHGNEAQCSMVVTIVDSEDPAITCPDDINQTADAGVCEALVSIAIPATDDNCGIASVTNDYNGSNDATDVYPVGTTTVTYTIIDNAGNQSQCSFDVTITDDEAPVITCPADINQTADATVCEASVSVPALAVIDNCDIASVVNDYNGTADASDVYPVGTTTVTYTVTDIHGNVSICAFTVTVTDDEAPVITCPADINQTADATVCEASVSVPALAVIDNCDIASVVNDYNGTANASDVYPVGTTTVTYTVTDIHGNVSTCAFTVTVTDDEAPVITCLADINQTADATVCEASVSVPALAVIDNCDIASIVNDYNGTADASDVYPVGTTTVTYTVTDIHGNVSICAFTVTVTDDEAPVITCPADINQTADATVCEASVSVPALAATDNCDIASIVNDYNGTADASDMYPVGTTTVTYTVTDIHGTVSTCAFTVTVTDDEAPVITCPADINQTADATVCEASVSVPALAATDNCDIASIVNDYNGTADASDVYPVGTTTVTYTVTDIHGNVSICAFTVTVTDDEAPAIDCPASITQTADAGGCDAVVSIPVPTGDDNCGVVSIMNDYNGTADASGIYTIGTTTVTWTITDIHGNTESCAIEVTITDDELPVINCPSDINQTADAGVCEAMISIDLPITDDNCGVASVTNDYNGSADVSDVYPVGTTVVTYTVIDNAGNETQCTFEVTVTDNEAPVITCPADINQTADAGVCEASVSVPALAATDNCDIATIVNDYNGTADASDMYPVGTTTVTFTVTDIHGNVTECAFNVIVTDHEAPAITCTENINQTADAGVCEAVITIPAIETADNCAVDTIVNDYNGTADASDVYPVGTTTVTFTVTDIHGNVTECAFNVTVTDDEAPLITCPEDMIELVDDACEFIIPDYTALAMTSDNCDLDLDLTQVPAPGTVISGSGTVQMIEITATDNSGNNTTCAFNITLDDVIAPSIVCPENQTEIVDGNCNFEIPDYTGMAVASDNCSVPVLSQEPATGTIVGLGTHDVTITAVDPDGNETSCTFQINAIDSTPPMIVCPEDQVEPLGDDCSFTLPDYLSMVESDDNCSDVTLSQSPAAGTEIFENTTITVMSEDIYGNFSLCQFEVILEDFIAPTIVCPADIEVNNDLGVCGAIVNYDLPETDDNCAVASLVLTEGLNSGEVFPVGQTVVSYEVTDGFGNTANCSFTVTVIDNELPTITCVADIFANADADQCGTLMTYDLPTTSDNCAIAEVNMIEGLASGEVFPVGITTVTYEVIDVNGNVNTCSFNVEITDTLAPVVDGCLENIEVENDLDECGAVVDFELPTATDNCAVTAVVLELGLEPGSFFPLGTTEMTYSFTDEAGNTSYCSFSVTVNDTQEATITCPADMTVSNDTGICGAFVNYPLPTVTDNCEAGEVVMLDGIPSGELFPVGETLLSFEVIDGSGNVSNCSFTVTVEDTEAPVILCPEDITQVDPVVFFDEPFYTDNCEANLILLEGMESGSEFPHGYTEIVYVATDLAGNADTCSFTILVNTPPVADDDTAEVLEEDDDINIDPLDNDYDPDGDDITITYVEAQNGDVTINSAGGINYDPFLDWCGTDTITYVICDPFMACDTAQIVVEVECFIDLIIPEGISPDGDGVNDTFEIIGLEDYPVNRLSIYNRWGRLVYESEDYQNDWDGTSQDALTLGSGALPEGTYFIVLELENGALRPVKGYVYLNR